MSQRWQAWATEPNKVDVPVRIVGGSGAVTKLFGQGASIAYVSTGVIDVTFPDFYGTFLGMDAAFDATTQSQVAGYTAVAGDPPSNPASGTSGTIRVNIFNNSNTLTDLTSTQRVLLTFQWRVQGS